MISESDKSGKTWEENVVLILQVEMISKKKWIACREVTIGSKNDMICCS